MTKKKETAVVEEFQDDQPVEDLIGDDPPAEAVQEEQPDVIGANAQAQLRGLVERIGRLEEDKAAVSADLKEVYAEAKSNGFDPKTLRKVIRIASEDKAKRQQDQALIDLYLSALGLL
jgi:uncharacterized protein (UPF0335 family)